jgi:iron complex transport system substrate-binding protein
VSAAPIHRARRKLIGMTAAAFGIGISGRLTGLGLATAAEPPHAGTARLDAQRGDARRIVVIGGALAEIVYALNAQARLVGADTTCTYPLAARQLPKVGYQRSLSAEGLLSLRPDLVLASADAGPPAALAQIKSAGVKVQTFAQGYDVETVRNKIGGIARVLDSTSVGATVLVQFDHGWQTACETIAASSLATRTGRAPRVLFVLNHTGNQALVAGERTAADAMLAYAGAANAMRGFNGYRPLTAEALVAAAPDIVLSTDEGLGAAGSFKALLAAPGFAKTPAGRAQRVVTLDALFLLGFGPRLPAAVVALNRKLAAA